MRRIKTYKVFESELESISMNDYNKKLKQVAGEGDTKSAVFKARKEFVSNNNVKINAHDKWNGEPAYFGYWYVDKTFDPSEIDNYDKKYKIAERSDHPLWVQCKYGANFLFNVLESKHKVRIIAGWFMEQEGYYSGGTQMTFYPSPGENIVDGIKHGNEHWWVEVDDEFYADITADQFFPHDPKKQGEFAVVLGKKSDLLKKLYYPIRRTYLKDVEITKDPVLVKLAEALVKKANKFKLGFTPAKLCEFIIKEGHGLNDVQLADLTATVRFSDVKLPLKDIESAMEFVSQTK